MLYLSSADDQQPRLYTPLYRKQLNQERLSSNKIINQLARDVEMCSLIVNRSGYFYRKSIELTSAKNIAHSTMLSQREITFWSTKASVATEAAAAEADGCCLGVFSLRGSSVFSSSVWIRRCLWEGEIGIIDRMADRAQNTLTKSCYRRMLI